MYPKNEPNVSKYLKYVVDKSLYSEYVRHRKCGIWVCPNIHFMGVITSFDNSGFVAYPMKQPPCGCCCHQGIDRKETSSIIPLTARSTSKISRSGRSVSKNVHTRPLQQTLQYLYTRIFFFQILKELSYTQLQHDIYMIFVQTPLIADFGISPTVTTSPNCDHILNCQWLIGFHPIYVCINIQVFPCRPVSCLLHPCPATSARPVGQTQGPER